MAAKLHSQFAKYKLTSFAPKSPAEIQARFTIAQHITPNLTHMTFSRPLAAFSRVLATRRFSGLPAFVFDIDGVLVRGNKPIPQAHEALSLLNAHKIPYILLTNGGGVSEKARVDFLSGALDVPLLPLQIVQSHTPMKAWTDTYRRVLVVGGNNDNARHVALDYGFEHVVVPMDIVRKDPAVAPHHRYTARELAEYARDVDLSQPFDAILVFNDPRDMGTDIQIVSDVLNLQDGLVGTKRKLPECDRHVPSVPIIFSNNDYLWANDYTLPRFGQGAFRMMVERLYAETNGLHDQKGQQGQTLQSTILGKPYKVQHDYAHWVLIEWYKTMNGHADHRFTPTLHQTPQSSPFSEIYMVGDNPESDICGANLNGWESMLLRTGVYKDDDWDTTVHRPSVGVFDNVLESVRYVLLK